MEIVKITTQKGKEREFPLFDNKKDSCPICDTPIADTYVSWNMFHGEVNRSCCNSPWQVKKWFADNDPNFEPVFEKLDNGGMDWLKIPEHLWEPLRQAFEKFGVKDCQNDEVYEEIKPII